MTDYKKYRIFGTGIIADSATRLPKGKMLHSFWKHENAEFSWQFEPTNGFADDGLLHIFKYPEPDCDYSIGVDTSMGIGEAPTVISVIRIGKNDAPDVQCAEFSSKELSPLEAYAYVLAIAAYYGHLMPHGIFPLLCIELMAGIEDVTQDKLRQIGYQRFHKFVHYDRNSDGENSRRCGWYTVGWSRPLLIDGLLEAIKRGWIDVRSAKTLLEINQVKDQAAEGVKKLHAESHFMACAIASFCSHDLDIMLEKKQS